MVLSTDGLIERRGASIDDGLTRLPEATHGRWDVTPDELCAVLLNLVDGAAQDAA